MFICCPPAHIYLPTSSPPHSLPPVHKTQQLQSLQDQNLVLQSKANRSKELSTQLAGSEHEVKTLTGHNHFLQRELDSCRRDLKTFRQELDELTEQMAEMGAEMMDAKIKVNSYARRLGEVEQELATTQELNVNLQVQLENALHRQKQTHSSTTQAVKLIQSDLGKVMKCVSFMFIQKTYFDFTQQKKKN